MSHFIRRPPGMTRRPPPLRCKKWRAHQELGYVPEVQAVIINHDIRSDGRTVWIDADTGFTVARFGLLGVDVHTPDTTACLDCTHGPTGPAEWDRFVASVQRHYGVLVGDEHRPTHCRAS